MLEGSAWEYDDTVENGCFKQIDQMFPTFIGCDTIAIFAVYSIVVE